MDAHHSVTRGPLRRFLLRRICAELYRAAGVTPRRVTGSYPELIRAAAALDRSVARPAELTSRGMQVLRRLVPRPFAYATRAIIHDHTICGKIAVLIVPRAVGWLVGPIDPRMAHSRAVIRRCEFLHLSGSVRQCMHLCKRPSEQFLRDALNIPIVMTPDPRTARCRLQFGRAAAADK